MVCINLNGKNSSRFCLLFSLLEYYKFCTNLKPFKDHTTGRLKLAKIKVVYLSTGGTHIMFYVQYFRIGANLKRNTNKMYTHTHTQHTTETSIRIY